MEKDVKEGVLEAENETVLVRLFAEMPMPLLLLVIATSKEAPEDVAAPLPREKFDSPVAVRSKGDEEIIVELGGIVRLETIDEFELVKTPYGFDELGLFDVLMLLGKLGLLDRLNRLDELELFDMVELLDERLSDSVLEKDTVDELFDKVAARDVLNDELLDILIS